MNITEAESPITISTSVSNKEEIIAALQRAEIPLGHLTDHFAGLVEADNELLGCQLERVWSRKDGSVVIQVNHLRSFAMDSGCHWYQITV